MMAITVAVDFGFVCVCGVGLVAVGGGSGRCLAVGEFLWLT